MASWRPAVRRAVVLALGVGTVSPLQQALAETLVCPQPGAPHPFIVTINQNRKLAKIEWQSSSTNTPCTWLWVDGRYAPTGIGASAPYCMMLSGGNGPVRQSVQIDGSNVVVSDGRNGGFTLDLSTGLMRNGNGVEECHHPHS